MSLYPTRMRYLLGQDFHGTVKKYFDDPKSLDAEIRNHLRRTGEYDRELEAKGVPEDQREELVYDFLAPTDVPDNPSPDEDLTERLLEWAQIQGEKS